MTSELIQNLLAEESNCRVVFLKLREARDHLEVECNKALHTLQMAKRKLYKASFTGNIMRDADGNRLMKLPASDTAECTRLVPDVPELVRYRLNQMGELVYSENGQYVLHSQAAAIIEAKDALIFEHQNENVTLQICLDKVLKRAEAAEAELAQIKAQEPVGTISRVRSYDTGIILFLPYDKNFHLKDGSHLFSEPVDQTAEIERLREALREVHTMIEHDRTGKFKPVQNVINAALSEKDPS